MHKRFLVSIDNLHQMLAFVRENIVAAEIDDATLLRVELAVEEALMNIISYSGLNDNDCLDISCTASPSSGIKIVIKDVGTPFNPLSKANKQIDRSIPLEKRELGGFGIHLILNLMDAVEYRYEDNQNILTLIKYT